MRNAFAALILSAFLFAASVPPCAADLGNAFAWVDAGIWGLGRDAVESAVTPVRTDKNIIVTEEALMDWPATANYLFNDAGRLYNISWYALIPVADIDDAAEVHHEVRQALDARYGSGRQLSGGGDPDRAKAREVVENLPRLAGIRERLEKMKAASVATGRKLDFGELQTVLEGRNLLEVVPTLFHADEAMWEDGTVAVYCSLLCSTDGDCYLHLNFVDKSQTASEPYPRGEARAPFSYSPLDRDQDLITKTNAGLAIHTE